MKIKDIVMSCEKELYIVFFCEHCGHEQETTGHDCDDFYNNVVPNMKCQSCHQSSKNF